MDSRENMAEKKTKNSNSKRHLRNLFAENATLRENLWRQENQCVFEAIGSTSRKPWWPILTDNYDTNFVFSAMFAPLAMILKQTRSDLWSVKANSF